MSSILASALFLLAEPAASGAASPPAETRWIKQHRPAAHDMSLGVFVGLAIFDRELELYDGADRGNEYDDASAELGIRLGYLAAPFIGFEGEVAAIPTRYGGESAFAFSARAHAIAQLALWRVVPFVVLGGGVLGVTADDDVTGTDTDPALHFGGGVKIHATEHLIARLDVRDVVSPSIGSETIPAHSPEVLVSFAWNFGVGPKPKPEPAVEAPVDTDGDGVADADDWCARVAGKGPNGCPVPDDDCDDVPDDVDECPGRPGPGPSGCPLPDGDGDGVPDASDACPEEAGVIPSGCLPPPKDPDGDGLVGEADQCPEQPETRNGFEDGDGCPDELPERVRAFEGAIEGIRFESGSANIRPSSRAVLDSAVAVLRDFPELRIEIVGHTDDVGTREANLELSKQRAEAVKADLVAHGIQADRIATRGAGPDEPRAENRTRSGRAENRRIEFHVLPPEPAS